MKLNDCSNHLSRILVLSILIMFLASNMILAVNINQESYKTLDVCLDPDYMPFSHAKNGQKGLHYELAQAIAAKLDVKMNVYWAESWWGKRDVKYTLLKYRCNAYFGLPIGSTIGTKIAFTRPFIEFGYALVLPESLKLKSADGLRGKKIGVQFDTPPTYILAKWSNTEMVTYSNTMEVMEALKNREVDAGFVWGPTAGFINHSEYGKAYNIIPVKGPYLQWKAAIAVRSEDQQFRLKLSRALGQLKEKVKELKKKYYFPKGKYIHFSS
ncbi:MAG: transporter substrate-binding domain-containing protein [Proteobacteria bacterium]|nr:transporter substrate-binding domain-containing protein [Pseudomonadota bacterium]